MGKTPRSFSIDESLDEAIRRQNDLNASSAVNQFLAEYIREGSGEEAALKVRLEQVDDEIAQKTRELEQLERERDRIETRLESRQSKIDEQLDEVEELVRNGEFPRGNISVDNVMIQERAAKAGVDAERFVDRLEARLS